MLSINVDENKEGLRGIRERLRSGVGVTAEDFVQIVGRPPKNPFCGKVGNSEEFADFKTFIESAVWKYSDWLD